jgi:hypothetical protein
MSTDKSNSVGQGQGNDNNHINNANDVMIEETKDDISLPQRIRAKISLDVESTGKSPANSSCVMLGFAVVRDGVDPNPYDLSHWVLEQKSWCIAEYRPRDPKTWTDFWEKNLDVWAYIEQRMQPVQQVMAEFNHWFRQLRKKYDVTFIAKPGSYDWQWLNCLHHEFGPSDRADIGFRAECISSMWRVCELAGADPRELNRFTMCKLFPHSHLAHQDALQQGFLYLKLCVWIKRYLKIVPPTAS